MMEIYSWETAVKTFFESLPQDDLAFNFMHFISYPKLMGWMLWITLFLIYFRKNIRQTATPFILGALAAGLGDLCSRRIFKVVFMRPRPWSSVETCFDASCWGFVSSHCTNVSAFVTVFALHNRRNLIWGLPVVLLVSLSRIYIGDHYLLDTIGGDFLGICLGMFVWRVYLIFLKFKKSSSGSEPRKLAKKSAAKLLGICLMIYVTGALLYTSYVRLTENFYEVDPGKFYRSAQLNPIELNERINQYGIKTVISLRGAPKNAYWYETQEELLKSKGVVFKNYWLDPDSFPSKDELLGLLEDFKSAPKPILIHCRSGADRTGMVSALYVFEELKQPKEIAMQQLHPKYWHFESFHPAMENFIREYDGRDWAQKYDECKYGNYAPGCAR